jgi:hypothetical protein
MEPYTYTITIKGGGTAKELIDALRGVANSIESAANSDVDALDGAEWEDSTLMTYISEYSETN